MNKIILFLSLVILASCGGKKSYKASDSDKNLDGIMDTIMPFFSKLNDTIPDADKFNPKFKTYFQQHKLEREYSWLHYTESKDGYAYFMVRRLEPSIKKDKYSGICGRYKHDNAGRIDLKSYEELFWTWKMKTDSLDKKSEVLFKTIVENGNVDQYLPGKSRGEWIMFPDDNVAYDKASQSWLPKTSY